MPSRPTRAFAALAVVAFAAAGCQRAAEPTAAPAPKTAAIALQPDDLLRVQRVRLAHTVELNGSVAAVRRAVLRSRSAGELVLVGAREGEAVRAGQPLLRVEDTELRWRLRQAERQADAAQAQLDIAHRALANSRALVAQGFVSPTALDNSVASEAAAQATLQGAQAAVELARKALADAEVRAPFAGIVAQRLAEPGERVGVGAPVLELVDLDRLEFIAALPPEQAASVRVGARATLSVDGLDAPVDATVVRLSPATQPGTRAVMAYLSLPAHPALRHGLFGRGDLTLQAREVLAVPEDAVRIERARPYLLEVAATTDGALLAREREVVLGPRGRHEGLAMVEVVEGAGEGMRLLAGRAGLLRDGMPLTLAASATAR